MAKKITLNKSGEISLKEGYLRFIQQKRAMNVAPDTIDYYDMCYKYFTDYLDEQTLCSEINSETAIDYILYLRQSREKISDTTVNTYLRGVRAIFYYLMEKGNIPAFKAKLIRAEKKIKETYTDDELNRLLKKPDLKRDTFAVYRNWVIVCYLLGTGNRARTVCNLKIGDIDFGTHEIRLKKVKNKKQYIIPLSKTLEKSLREYLEYRQGEPDDCLFCNAYGQPMTQEGLASAIYYFNTSRGVAKYSIHLFRHTFAKKWILNRGDIFRLQQVLGHSSIEIVKEYVNMYGHDLRQGFDEFNPLDNMSVEVNRQKIDMKRK